MCKEEYNKAEKLKYSRGTLKKGRSRQSTLDLLVNPTSRSDKTIIISGEQLQFLQRYIFHYLEVHQVQQARQAQQTDQAIPFSTKFVESVDQLLDSESVVILQYIAEGKRIEEIEKLLELPARSARAVINTITAICVKHCDKFTE